MPAADMLPHAVVHPVVWRGDPWARETVADVRASLAHPWAATASLGVSTPTLGRTITMPPPRGTSGMDVEHSFIAWAAVAQPHQSPEAVDVLGAGHTRQHDCGWHVPGMANRGSVVIVIAPPRRDCAGGLGSAITTTHELVESVTDPRETGWHSSSSSAANELADACASQTYRIDTTADVIDPADILVLDPHTGRCSWLWSSGAALTSIAHPDPMVASVPGGTWTVTPAGAVTITGTAKSYGSMGGKHLASPIVGIAATPNGKGYWLAAADGGVFAFGDAPFYGSVQSPGTDTATYLASPPSTITGIAAGTSPRWGAGYCLVAADGDVFTFDASGPGVVQPESSPPGRVVGVVPGSGCPGTPSSLVLRGGRFWSPWHIDPAHGLAATTRR